LGASGTGVGVLGHSQTNDGVAGFCAADGKSGVFGFNSINNGVAFGVFGRCNSPAGAGVSGRNDNGDGVSGFSVNGNAVKGRSAKNDGVIGESDIDGKSGVFGFNTHSKGAAFGVSGTTGSPDGTGVFGFADAGNGVKGASKSNDGVVGISDSLNRSGVFGFNSKTSGGFAFGVFGRCDAPQETGVSGRNDAENGDAVSGFSPKGYGGHFIGGRAPLRLDPANAIGPPTSGSHQSGEFFVDRNGDLFYCKQGGTPGAWFRIALVPA
jgi:hypothetical protein